MLRDVAALYDGRVCSRDKQEQCKDEYGRFFDKTCRRCQNDDAMLPIDQVDPYTWHLLDLRALRRGGYPFAANDLPVSTWQLLGRIEDSVDGAAEQRERRAQAAMAGMKLK